MLNRFDARALRHLLLLATCACLASCPTSQRTSAPRSSEPITEGRYPKVALEHLQAALESPTQGYPALNYSWAVVSQMELLPSAEGGAAIRAQIGRQVTQSGEGLPNELLAAWLNTAPDAAKEHLTQRVRTGSIGYMRALWFKPQLARELFADPLTRQIDLDNISREQGDDWLRLVRFWGHVDALDDSLLTALSNRTGQPENTLRAAGWLLHIDPGDELLLGYLRKGLAEGAEKTDVLSAAADGVRIAGDPSVLDAIEPLLAEARMQGEPVRGPHDAQPIEPLYGAYALALLPGDEARALRQPLLNSAEPMVLWQAALGELLFGDPAPWDAAVAEHGIDAREMLLSLEPPELAHPDLLPTLELAAEAEDTGLRLWAATQLGRYRPYSSDGRILALLERLQADAEAPVREATWYAAGKLGLGGASALEVVQDGAEDPQVRMGAAYCALMLAQGGSPEARWPRIPPPWESAALKPAGTSDGRSEMTGTTDETAAAEGGD